MEGEGCVQAEGRGEALSRARAWVPRIARPVEAKWPPSMGGGGAGSPEGAGEEPVLHYPEPPPQHPPPHLQDSGTSPPPPPCEPRCREPPDIIRLVLLSEGPRTPSRLPWQPGSALRASWLSLADGVIVQL